MSARIASDDTAPQSAVARTNVHIDPFLSSLHDSAGQRRLGIRPVRQLTAALATLAFDLAQFIRTRNSPVSDDRG
jgi:hypothetical protein